MEQYEPDELLGMTGVQHLFDAYIAGLFARIWNDHQSCKVRLVPSNFPDAQCRDDNATLDLEITMADRMDRQMALEHRRLREARERGDITSQPIDRDGDRTYALEAVPRVCSAKAKKYLGKEISDQRVEVDLLIYLNFSTLAGPVLTHEEMVDLTKPWRNNFRSIWLLCGARVFRAWPSPRTFAANTDPFS